MFSRDELRYLTPMICAYIVSLCAFGVAWILGATLFLRAFDMTNPAGLMVTGFVVGLPARDMSKVILRGLLAQWYGDGS